MKKKIIFLLFSFIVMGFSFFLLNSCDKDDINKVPVLTTSDVSNITQTTANSGGNITSDGGSIITGRGVCWSLGTTPTIADSITTDGTGTGSFKSNITGLNLNTTYYVRAYAINSADTGYGSVFSFTTQPVQLPILTTGTISNIKQTTASCGGNITSDGGSTVTARGVSWSTSQNPSIANNRSIDGAGGGSFTSSITGLGSNTKYYLRAYAINNAGIGYGNEISFTTIPTLSIGDSYQGGIVAYILHDNGYNANEQHGLIVAPYDQSSGIQWYNGSYISILTFDDLGNGNANTNTIVRIQGEGSYAAKLCYDLVLGGYSDWYLPNGDELYLIYDNSWIYSDISGFANSYYWSSSEYDVQNAWAQNFKYSTTLGQGFKKDVKLPVRAVRSF